MKLKILMSLKGTYDCNNNHHCILSSEKPTVTMSSKPHLDLKVGERLTLTCQANEATEVIRWTKDYDCLTEKLRTNVNIDATGKNSTLVIEKVLTFDSGKYSCIAFNNESFASSSAYVRVTGNKKHKV